MNVASNSRHFEVFDVAIDSRRNEHHPVRVIDSPGGSAFEDVQFPEIDDRFRARLIELESTVMTPRYDHAARQSESAQASRDLGAALFTALFHDSVHTAYVDSQGRVNERDHGLRIQLRVRDEGLAALPWESLFDPQRDEYVALRANTSVVRFPEILGAPRPIEVDGPVRVLGVVVEVEDPPRIDARAEREFVDEALEPLVDEGLMSVAWLENPNWRELGETITDGTWHVLHYVGHARPGFIRLDDDGGDEPGEIDGRALAGLLGQQPALRLAVLNACESSRGDGADALASTAHEIAKADVSAVIAMQYKVHDSAAIEFSRTFYRQIAYRQSVDEAMAKARAAMDQSVEFTLQWMVPVLHMRSTNGALFASAAGPDALEALSIEGHSHFRTGQWVAAASVFGELNQLQPSDPVWKCWLALARSELGSSDARTLAEDAIDDLSETVEENPDTLELVGLRGLTSAFLGRCEEALKDLDAVINARVAKVAELLARGRCHLRTGRPQTAFADFTQAIAADPFRAEAYHERSKILVGKEDYEAALEDLNRAVEISPTDLSFRSSRAAVYREMGQYDLAAQDLVLALEAAPNDPDLYMERGYLYYQMAYYERTEDYSAAIEDYGKAIELEPADASGWFLRGRSQWQMADETDSTEHARLAARDLAEAVRLDATQGTYQYYLGLSLKKLGDRASAKQAFLRAVKLGEDRARAQLSLWHRLFGARTH